MLCQVLQFGVLVFEVLEEFEELSGNCLQAVQRVETGCRGSPCGNC